MNGYTVIVTDGTQRFACFAENCRTRGDAYNRIVQRLARGWRVAEVEEEETEVKEEYLA